MAKTKKKTTKKKAKKTTKKTKTISTTAPQTGDATAKKTRPEVVPMPTAGHKVTEFEDKLDASLAAGEQEPKRARGRPRKIEEPPSPEIDVKVFAQCLQIPFDLWSVSQGVEGLKLSTSEAIMLAKPIKQLADYYLPSVPEIAWAWFSLAGVSYTIVKSRLIIIAEIKKVSSMQTGSDNVKPEAARASVSQGQGSLGPTGFPNIKDVKKNA